MLLLWSYAWVENFCSVPPRKRKIWTAPHLQELKNITRSHRHLNHLSHFIKPHPPHPTLFPFQPHTCHGVPENNQNFMKRVSLLTAIYSVIRFEGNKRS